MHDDCALPPNPLAVSHKGKRRTIFRIPPKPLAMPGRRFFVMGSSVFGHLSCVSVSSGVRLRGQLKLTRHSDRWRPDANQSVAARPLADTHAARILFVPIEPEP